MKTKNVGSRSAARWPSVMRMRSIACCLAFAIASLVLATTGCTTQTMYLRESEKVVHLNAGDAAPHDGWLLSDDDFAGLYDRLERKLADEEDAGQP